MEILLILIYVAFCMVIFKIFKIPVNQWSLSTAALGGIFGISLLLLVMNYNHPFTKNARIYFGVTPIFSGVSGRVIEVPVQPNVLLKEGDELYKIDPRPYQYIVDQKKAALADAEQSVKQLKTSLDQATANTERAQAQLELAQQTYDRQAELLEKKVIAQATLDTASRNLEASKQTVAGAKAAEERARLGYSAEIGGVNTTVARLTAELGAAQFDLEQTVVRAPGPGYATTIALRPGMYTVPMPLRPVMVFVNTGPRDKLLAASFQQNALQRIEVGAHAEIAFDAVPGTVFKGRVKQVLDVIAGGAIQATGNITDFGAPVAVDRATAEIEILDDISQYQIPLGSAAQVAVLTEHWEELGLLRRILLRMRSWENYLYTEGHG